MGLGRNKGKRSICLFEGHIYDCPKDCIKCAIAITAAGDIALADKRFDDAIRLYKKAAFADPKFADAWVNMGHAYSKKSEYNNAISSFNKAIAIDPSYGEALFGKAIAMQKQGRLDEAMKMANSILEMYDDEDVEAFKTHLVSDSARNTNEMYSAEKAIYVLTDKAYEIIRTNNLLDVDGRVGTEKKIFNKEDFARSIFSYCKKHYYALGNDKVWSESILSAFYGSICITLLFYADMAGFDGVSPFEYLKDHINLEELDRNAEKLMGIRNDASRRDKAWSIVFSYVKFCIDVFNSVEPESDTEAVILDATESAYVMGMLYAMRHQRIVTSIADDNITDGMIADTFDDFKWYSKEQNHHWLERIQIDIEKRLRISGKTYLDSKRRCELLAQNNVFAFYSCNEVILRKNKSSGEVVYFGHGRVHQGAIMENKFYWVEHTGINGEHRLFCANFDRSSFQQLDCLSKNTARIYGHMSFEDRIENMETVGSQLIIYVVRLPESGKRYRILVSDQNEDIQIEKELIEGSFVI